MIAFLSMLAVTASLDIQAHPGRLQLRYWSLGGNHYD